MCPEVRKNNPRSRQGQFTCRRPTWLKTSFNLDALYLVWSFSMVLVAAWLGSSENWKPRWTRGVSKIIWNYQCYNPDIPGSGVEWKCGDTLVRISTHPPGTYRGPEVQGFLSSMGPVRLSPDNCLMNEHSYPFKLTRRSQQTIEWVYNTLGTNRNGEKCGVTPLAGMDAAFVRREQECNNEEESRGGGQTLYCKVAFVGVPCENIVG